MPEPSKPAMTMRQIRERLGYAIPPDAPEPPAAWVDGDPLMEAIAAAVWEHCETDGLSLVIDDPRTIAATAAAVARASSSAPVDDSERRDRYAQAIRDSNGIPEALNWWKANPQLIPAGVYAGAAIAVADAEQAELRRERDLAIAHDRQPYPTAWAYEQACKALHRKEAAIDRVLEFAARLDETGRQLAGPDAVHPVGAHIRHLLDTPADDEQQPEEAENPRTACVCGHTRGKHITVSGRLLCDECDPDSTDNLVCKEFEAL